MDDDQPSAQGRADTASIAPRRQLLSGLRDVLAKWSGVHLKSFLDKLDQELFRLADHADNNADQSRYWQTRAELVSHRALVEQRMSDRLREAFQAFVDRRDTWVTEQRDAAAPESGDITLQLMEDDHLERSLAVDSMSRRVAADCSEALYALHQRLSVLAAGQKVTEQGNPVAPRIFAETLDTGLASLAIDNRARLLIYKFYDVQLMQRLSKLYELLNHHLKAAGVLPNLQYTIERQQRSEVRELAGSADSASQQHQYQLMALIRQLQAKSALTGEGPGRAANPDVVDRVHAVQLVAALGGLQRRGAEQLQAAGSIDALMAAGSGLQRQLEDEAARGLDAQTIEIVGLLFEYMLNDELLPDSVKALLSYLHTPFLKMALSDRAFLGSPQHPARQLLNSLVAAGERWVEPDGRHRNEVFQQMRRIVQRALHEFDMDAGLFSELLTEFNSALHQYAQRINRAEQRAREIARGEDRLREGRQQVEQFLLRRCAGVPLTSAARELLFGPWAHYQAFVWLRFGTESPAWEEASDAVDALVHYLGPNRLRDENLERVLLAGLRGGLEMVGYDQAKGEALLAALAQSCEGDAVAEPVPVEEQPPVRIDEDAELSRLVTLGFGTWFLFDADLPRKQQKRLRLAWYNDRTLRFMFVNRLGQQIAVKQGPELARELREGRTRVLGDLTGKPFFEKALERIAEQLKGSVRPPALI